MSKKNFLKITTYAAVFGIIGGMSFEGVTYLSDKLINKTAVESPGITEEQTEDKDTVNNSTQDNNTATDNIKTVSSTNGVSDVVEDVLPSLVAINVTATQTKTDFFGRTYEQNSSGSGSGIIVGKDSSYLYVATNNHVVAGADKVSVQFYDDKVYDAVVKGTDSTADIAVAALKLKDIAAETMEKIKIAKLGDSDSVKVGQQAIAIGNALGYGTSVTVGYISAKDREVQSEDATMKLMQTDAAINPGNSGGALVDINGSVIGINSAKYADTEVEGMGFAIPVNTATPIIQSIINAEEVSEEDAAYLGIIPGKEIPSEYAEYYHIPEGVFVEDVTEDSPAKEAGIQKGDIIVKFNDMEVTTTQSLQEKLALLKAGKKVNVVVKRSDNGEYIEKSMEVTLGKKPDAETDSNVPSDNNSSSGGNKNNIPYSSGNSFNGNIGNFLQ